jgi:spore coat polysaccharide biosynthesis protein SpsF
MDGMVKKRPRVAAIIQARMGSTRLPGKAMMDLAGKNVLTRVIDRVKAAKGLDSICVATTSLTADGIIAEEALKSGVEVFRGSEADVLDRFCRAARKMKADYVIRVTADNPLTDPGLIDLCIAELEKGKTDYAAFSEIPYGAGAEMVSTDALVKASKYADKTEKEHVTTGIYTRKGLYAVNILEPPVGLERPDIRVTLDTLEDYTRLYDIFSHFKKIPAGKIKLDLVIRYIDSKEKNENRA